MIVYHVNKEKGVIVARFEGDFDYWKKSLEEMCYNICGGYNDSVHRIVWNILIEYPNLTGKAKLHPNDTWNESCGKMYAKKALLDKWYRVKNRVLRKLKDRLYMDYQKVNDRFAKKLFVE